MNRPSDVLAVSHLRIARSSDDPDATARFYVDALRFEVQARFVDHDGFDGVVVGRAGWPWHLEFTREHGTVHGPASDDEHLLVLGRPGCDVRRALSLESSCAP